MSEQLERYVWELEKCAGCGACVACCSKGVLQFSEAHEHPILGEYKGEQNHQPVIIKRRWVSQARRLSLHI